MYPAFCRGTVLNVQILVVSKYSVLFLLAEKKVLNSQAVIFPKLSGLLYKSWHFCKFFNAYASSCRPSKNAFVLWLVKLSPWILLSGFYCALHRPYIFTTIFFMLSHSSPLALYSRFVLFWVFLNTAENSLWFYSSMSCSNKRAGMK